MSLCPFTREYCIGQCELWQRNERKCTFTLIAENLLSAADVFRDMAAKVDAPESKDSNTVTERKNDILDESIDHLDLSVRSWNCLKRANIDTVRQVIETARYCGRLTQLRNLGYKSELEIQERIKERCGIDIYDYAADDIQNTGVGNPVR